VAGRKIPRDDLEIQRRAIVETVAKADPTEEVHGLGPSGFRAVRRQQWNGDWRLPPGLSKHGDVALKAKANAANLADKALAALIVNDCGQFDDLDPGAARGQVGLEYLKQRTIDLSKRPVTKAAEKDRLKIGWSSSGLIYADEMAERSRVSKVPAQKSPTPWVMSMPSLSNTRKKLESCRKSPRKSRGASFRLAGRGRRGRRLKSGCRVYGFGFGGAE
jgi:hypothetical protein